MFKLNNGNGAILCDWCSTIIKQNTTKDNSFKDICVDCSKDLYLKYLNEFEDRSDLNNEIITIRDYVNSEEADEYDNYDEYISENYGDTYGYEEIYEETIHRFERKYNINVDWDLFDIFLNWL